MKKQMIAAALAAMFCLSACGKAEKTSEKASEATGAEETTVSEVTSEAETEPETTEEITTESETYEFEEIPTQSEAPVAHDSLSDKYADLDNRSFIYKDHIYTLGVSTLQDFIDNKVIFAENDDFNAMESGGYTGNIDGIDVKSPFKYTIMEGRAVLYFANIGEKDIKRSECVLVQMTYDNFSDERRGAQNNMQFAFPKTLTKDELIENSGEPTFIKEEGNNYSYYAVSEKEPHILSGYMFIFFSDEYANTGDDGKLSMISMNWVP